jgi:hypothetical protein
MLLIHNVWPGRLALRTQCWTALGVFAATLCIVVVRFIGMRPRPFWRPHHTAATDGRTPATQPAAAAANSGTREHRLSSLTHLILRHALYRPAHLCNRRTSEFRRTFQRGQPGEHCHRTIPSVFRFCDRRIRPGKDHLAFTACRVHRCNRRRHRHQRALLRAVTALQIRVLLRLLLSQPRHRLIHRFASHSLKLAF